MNNDQQQNYSKKNETSKVKYSCKICDLEFISRESLSAHMCFRTNAPQQPITGDAILAASMINSMFNERNRVGRYVGQEAAPTALQLVASSLNHMREVKNISSDHSAARNKPKIGNIDDRRYAIDCKQHFDNNKLPKLRLANQQWGLHPDQDLQKSPKSKLK